MTQVILPQSGALTDAAVEMQMNTPTPGHFGPYGGQFAPETLMVALREIEDVYNEAKQDAAFKDELAGLLRDFAGRPTPLYFAERLTAHYGGAKIFLKREPKPLSKVNWHVQRSGKP